MAGLGKNLKVSMKNRPKNFMAKLIRELREDLIDDTPEKTGKLRSKWRIRNLGKGKFRVSNTTDYASYVNKSGPRRGGEGTAKFWQKNTNISAVRKLADDVAKGKR